MNPPPASLDQILEWPHYAAPELYAELNALTRAVGLVWIAQREADLAGRLILGRIEGYLLSRIRQLKNRKRSKPE